MSARDLKIAIPADLSVTGFDDIALAALVVPRLTTLRQPIEQLAGSAVERIFAGEAAADEAIAGEIVVRESTGNIPNP